MVQQPHPLELIGDIPPAEDEKQYIAMLDVPTMTAYSPIGKAGRPGGFNRMTTFDAAHVTLQYETDRFLD
ncbi:hypothetical protein Brsp01_43830 [Brucella sp. NBRC 12950]|nr:hypothetical protein Brsp01_43830 [Brucella sp. NBRC 12950]